MSTGLIRKAATDAAKAKFEGQALVWGRADCARLAAFTIAQMGLKPSLSAFGRYTSPETALRRIRERGFADITAALDAIEGLARTPFAYAMAGDILALESPHSDFPALHVYIGNGKSMGFDSGEPPVCRIGEVLKVPLITWKVTPCPAP